MSMTLWWIGDAMLLLGVFPVMTLFLLRIIKPLQVGLRALLSIAQSTHSITSSLPTGMTELAATARSAANLDPRGQAAV